MDYYHNIFVSGVFKKSFTYKSDSLLTIGTIVKVPFRHKSVWGIVCGQVHKPEAFSVKSVEEVSTLTPLNTSFVDFFSWFSSYTLTPIGGVVKMILSCQRVLEKDYIPKKPLEMKEFEDHLAPLNQEQHQAFSVIHQSLNNEKFKPILLKGVTGSGKTEVYFKAAFEAIKNQKQVLILLPEIGLTAAFVKRFEERFKVRPCVWHSNIPQSQKNQIWKGVLEGNVKLVLGTRSSLFLPFNNLGLIIVDEEHDSSYKQEEQVIYHGRDMAVTRAKHENAVVLLCSATPSLESLKNVEKGRYELVTLAERHGVATLPKVMLLDAKTKEQGTWITPALKELLAEKLQKKEQSLLFLNRKGYAPLTLCHGCGHRFMCPRCSFWLVHHKKTQKLHCHYCEYESPIPKECPSCQQIDTLVPIGPGIERIFEEVSTLFPTARIQMITKETFSNAEEIQSILDKIYKNELDILVATQILAKGYHFPHLTLVGIIDADIGLSGGDFRAGEKTFQLLHQVSGRSGREDKEGIVAIQTYAPEHPLMQALMNQNVDAFVSNELEARKNYHMPPFGKMLSILISSAHEKEAQKTAALLAQSFSKFFKDPTLLLLGPTPAALYKLKNRHRYRLLIHNHQPKLPFLQITQWLDNLKVPSTVSIKVDVDPLSVL